MFMVAILRYDFFFFGEKKSCHAVVRPKTTTLMNHCIMYVIVQMYTRRQGPKHLMLCCIYNVNYYGYLCQLWLDFLYPQNVYI